MDEKLKEDLEAQDKLQAAILKAERAQRSAEIEAERDQRKRDMGVGYLIWAARKRNRISQLELARRVGVSPSALCRWECGNRVPSLRSLQAVAQHQGYELLIGLVDAKDKEVKVAGIIEHELPVAELDLFADIYRTEMPRPTPWRVS